MYAIGVIPYLEYCPTLGIMGLLELVDDADIYTILDKGKGESKS